MDEEWCSNAWDFYEVLYVEPRRDLIETLVHFWDPLRNVFRFSYCELTPTLEEIGAFIGKGKHLRKGEPMIPKYINGRRFLELLHINENDIGGCLNNGWVPLEFLYKRYGKSDEFEVYGKKLCNNGCHLT